MRPYTGESEVRFEGAPGHTRVDVTMNYADPPGGAVGETLINILSNPERKLREDLENLARIVEREELGGPEARVPSRSPPSLLWVSMGSLGRRARRPLYPRGRKGSWVSR